MIILKPTRGIVKITKLDYDLISFILSRFVITKQKVSIRIEKSRYSFSYYCDNRKIICLNTDEGTSLRFTINTLLHEIRHYMQMRQKCDSKDNEYTSYWSYYSSPKEKDARKFEKITTEICKIYNQYKIIEEKFKRYELDYFKELCYNEAVDSNDLQ
jgi:hypothetical protein